MPVVIEWAFEPPRDIVTSAIPCGRHRIGRGQAPATRTANEEKIVVCLDSEGLQFVRKALGKARIDRLVGKRLPLNEDNPFSKGPEIRDTYIRPFRACTHID